MVKIEMYKSFDGKIFENRENCMAYEENEKRNRKMQYKKLEELKQKFDEYCEIGDECEDCIFASHCEDVYDAITQEMRRLEGE
jgi:hypothetical protein